MGSGVFEVTVPPNMIAAPPEPPKNIGTLYPGQRWIELEGRFTPENLREMADRIEEHVKGVPPRGNSQ